MALFDPLIQLCVDQFLASFPGGTREGAQHLCSQGDTIIPSKGLSAPTSPLGHIWEAWSLDSLRDAGPVAAVSNLSELSPALRLDRCHPTRPSDLLHHSFTI